jgi:hypothetical protein
MWAFGLLPLCAALGEVCLVIPLLILHCKVYDSSIINWGLALQTTLSF